MVLADNKGEQLGLLSSGRSIGIALNVPSKSISRIVDATHDIDCVNSYVLSGLNLGPIAIQQAVADINEICSDKTIIYDHQKAGTTDQSLAPGFAADMSKVGFDALVLFASSNPESQEKWINTVQESELVVILGIDINKEKPIHDSAAIRIIDQAQSLGVRDFWVRGYEQANRVNRALCIILGVGGFTLHVTRVVGEDGKIDALYRPSANFNLVVGRAIFNAADIRQAAQNLAEQVANDNW